jgi:hypothetical protein
MLVGLEVEVEGEVNLDYSSCFPSCLQEAREAYLLLEWEVDLERELELEGEEYPHCSS